MRAAQLPGVAEILTVTNRDYYFKTKDEYLACQVNVTACYLLEPCGRNTATAIAFAALYAEQAHGADACLLVLPADHLIENQPAFASAVATASDLASRGHLATFGIQPSAPETGFGYIEAGDVIATKLGAGRMARRFVEKPDAATAQGYLASVNFYWNSGMFCFAAGTLLDTMAQTCPEVLAAARACRSAANTAEHPIEFPREAFIAQPDISIDYAVMEKASNVAVMPCDLGWSDIVSWTALGALVAPDEYGNRTLGEAVLVDA